MGDRIEWGPWIEHDGNGCPSSVMGQYIRAEYRTMDGDLVQNEGFVHRDLPPPAWKCWSGGGWWKRGREWCAPVLRYQIRKPRGLELLQDLIAELPAPRREVEHV